MHRANTAKRHERIRAAFAQEYTQQPTPRKHSRAYVVAQLAERFGLATSTVEKIVLTK